MSDRSILVSIALACIVLLAGGGIMAVRLSRATSEVTIPVAIVPAKSKPISIKVAETEVVTPSPHVATIPTEQKKIEKTPDQAELDRLRSENEKLREKLAPAPPVVALPPEPAQSDFRVFGDRFLNDWLIKEARMFKETTRSSPNADPPPVFSGVVTGIDKIKSNSLINPIVWTLTTAESMKSSDGVIQVDYSHVFNFAWDGKRWVGLESSFRSASTERKEDAKSVDAVATTVQRMKNNP